MTIGALRVEMLLNDSMSLKDKRSASRRLKDRMRNKFNVSVAEVDDMDKTKKLVIEIAAVSNDKKHLHSYLDKIMDFIEDENKMMVLDYSSEVF